MGLDISDLIYEHLLIGSKEMLRGLFLDRDVSWSLYPLLLAIRMTAYGVRFPFSKCARTVEGKQFASSMTDK
jgi:hypothetical protein